MSSCALRDKDLDRVGSEHTPLALSQTLISRNPTEDGTQDGTQKGEISPIDPDLARLIEALPKVWPTLSDEARAGILREVGL